jgi:hypothetical protein
MKHQLVAPSSTMHHEIGTCSLWLRSPSLKTVPFISWNHVPNRRYGSQTTYVYEYEPVQIPTQSSWKSGVRKLMNAYNSSIFIIGSAYLPFFNPCPGQDRSVSIASWKTQLQGNAPSDSIIQCSLEVDGHHSKAKLGFKHNRTVSSRVLILKSEDKWDKPRSDNVTFEVGRYTQPTCLFCQCFTNSTEFRLCWSYGPSCRSPQHACEWCTMVLWGKIPNSQRIDNILLCRTGEWTQSPASMNQRAVSPRHTGY